MSHELTIVIPCRKGTLPLLTLTSLWQQNYQNFVVVLVHDHERVGAASTRNRGFEIVTTPFVLFSDDDLVWLDGAIQSMIDALVGNSEASYAYGPYVLDGHIVGQVPFDAEKLKQSNFISTMAIMRTDHFIGFDVAFAKKCPRFDDWQLWLRMLKQGKTGVFVDRIMFLTRSSADGLSCSKGKAESLAMIREWQNANSH